ncbi:MAG TPA: hypothetical protein VGZ29_17160 [Terriglobia bacterium]|nr:hypothetical protein [Terriglobia bacterium]
MTCPICKKRKSNRFCPAKGEKICAVCCATEREVTIDCPSGCPHLIASRQYEDERREIDWSGLPFGDVKVSPAAFRGHETLLDAIAFGICDFAAQQRLLVDSDAIAALQVLAESYQTLARGIYYEKPLDDRVRHELYAHLKEAIANYRKEEAARSAVSSLRDGTVRDALIFMTQLGATRTNGRPKGRAFLDFLRSQFKWQGRPETSASNLVILP